MPKSNPTSAKPTSKKGKTPVSGAPDVGTTPKPRREKSPGRRSVEIDPNLVKGKRPSDEAVAQRQDLAYRLRILGKSPEEIGEAMGLAPRTVREYIRHGRERQVSELRRLEGKAGVLRQFTVLNYLLEEALDAWEKSKAPKKSKTAGVETFTVGTGSEEGSTKRKAVTREEERLGDVAYMDRALRASKEIRELLGLDPPEVKRLLVDEGAATTALNEDLRTLSDEELLRRYRATAGIGS